MPPLQISSEAGELAQEHSGTGRSAPKAPRRGMDVHREGDREVDTTPHLAVGVHFIEKPFSPRALAEKVREVLDEG